MYVSIGVPHRDDVKADGAGGGSVVLFGCLRRPGLVAAKQAGNHEEYA
jgi:hypothetical protein